jgi:hypothetical protein
MPTQNYANHRRLVPMFHGVLFGIIVLTLIGSVVNLAKSIDDHQRLYSASLLVAVCVALVLLFFFTRIFALKAQDRAIRAEENLRHLALTGKMLDARLGTLAVVALRFAPDGEFVALARRAAEEGMSPDAIKRAIREWRADTYRV